MSTSRPAIRIRFPIEANPVREAFIIARDAAEAELWEQARTNNRKRRSI